MILTTVSISTVFQPEANGLMWNVLGTGKVWLFIILTPISILSIDFIFKISADLFWPNADTKFIETLYRLKAYKKKSKQKEAIKRNSHTVPLNSDNLEDDPCYQLSEEEEHKSAPISESRFMVTKPPTDRQDILPCSDSEDFDYKSKEAVHNESPSEAQSSEVICSTERRNEFPKRTSKIDNRV